MNALARALIAGFAAASLAFAAAAPARADGPDLPEFPTVSTFAGTGASGERDGEAAQAEFIAPRGLAVAADGTVYVADYAAQRIRRIDPSGTVSTFAGAPAPAVNPEYHAGAYLDGPASQARFDGPAAVALAPDGSLLVADSRNHCVRRVANGVVTTFAGSPARAKANDGPAATASLHEPLGLAFGGDGTLYVADFGAGLRAIDRSGAIATLDNYTDLTSVAVRTTSRGSDVIAFGDGGIVVHHAVRAGLPAGSLERIDAYAETQVQGHQRLGNPYAGIAIGDGTVVFTDIRAQTIREVHLPGATSGTLAATRVVAGSSSIESANDGDAPADGAGPSARFVTPFAIARRPDGTYLIADAAAHRLRAMTDFEHRYVDEPLPGARAPGEYRIAFVGNSYAWYDTDWTTSIEGVLERRLKREREALQLPPSVRVLAFSFPGIDASALSSFVREELATGSVDAVVLEVDSPMALLYLPDPAGPDVLERLRTQEAIWRPKLVRDMSAIAASLRAANVPLIALYHPVAYDYSSTEAAAQGLPNEPVFDHAGDAAMFAAFRSAIPDCFDATPLFEAASARGTAPLFQSYVGHFAPLGRTLVADATFDLLAKSRPWLHRAR